TKSDEESDEEEKREEEEESFDPIPRTPEDSEDDGKGEEDQGLRVSEEQRLIKEEEADELYRDIDINHGREEEKESFDPIPRTPEDSEDDGNGEEDQCLRVSEEQRLTEEEEADELYRDVDINQGRGLQLSQDIEDSHVTLTPVHPDGQQESSSVSSFVTSMLNPISDAGVESIFTTVSSSVAHLPTPIPTMTPSIITTIITASHPPIPPTPIPSEVLQNLPTFDSVFRFNERLKSLEASFSEYRQTNPFAEVVSNIPGGEPELACAPLEPATKSAGRSTTGFKSRQASASESAFAEEPVQTISQIEEPSHPVFETELEYHLEEVYKAITDQLDWVNLEGQQYPHNLLQPLPLIPDNRGRRVIPFAHFINNDLEYLRGGASSQKCTTSVTKTKAADYGWIEDLVPRTMWIQELINYDKHAFWGVSHWGRKRQQFYRFTVNRESTLDVYSKRRIIAVINLKIVEWHNYKHLDWIS
nr:hypothetical protein [Tanacetum cinerariifolium]